MLLIFTFEREDIFSIDELGVQQAIFTLYKIDANNKKYMQEKLFCIYKKWSPYITYTCKYLWSYKDNLPKT
jgi:DNA-3-methyladenine glycosylase II